jgi:regulator of replication initiation timing
MNPIMQPQLDQVSRIQGKLQTLVQELILLRKENAKLKQELDQTQLKLQSQQETIQQLHEQTELLKINSGSGLDQESKIALEKKLDQYIREIDKCLSMMND